MSSKGYPDEFKIEAVKQVVDRGHSVADVAGILKEAWPGGKHESTRKLP
jgi:hypothetical protein